MMALTAPAPRGGRGVVTECRYCHRPHVGCFVHISASRMDHDTGTITEWYSFCGCGWEDRTGSFALAIRQADRHVAFIVRVVQRCHYCGTPWPDTKAVPGERCPACTAPLPRVLWPVETPLANRIPRIER